MNSKIRWSIFNFPLHGILKDNMTMLVESMPEPWLNHAMLCIGNEGIYSSSTILFAGMLDNCKIVTYLWMSLPDKACSKHEISSAYIFHVFVSPEYRGACLGTEITLRACSFANQLGINKLHLATSNTKLKEKLYGAIGFMTVGDDPWLMRYETIPAILATNIISSDNGVNGDAIEIRKVTHHDLATIQSICANNHWTCNVNNSYINKPSEVEEVFCEILKNKTFKENLLVHGCYHTHKYISWSILNNNEWQHQLITTENAEQNINKIANYIMQKLNLH